jgi:hypothetical protein
MFQIQVSNLLCPWARQLYLIENLHLSGHPVVAVVLRDIIKFASCRNVQGDGSTVMTHMGSMLKKMYQW